MFQSAWLCVYFLAPLTGTSPESTSAPLAKALKAYEERKTKAGADACSQVDLALWCEANGLKAERTKHLNLAVLAEPKSSLARGLLGQVEIDGRWDDPDSVRTQIQADESLTRGLAEYNRNTSSLASGANRTD
jgi:hypothetical protein